MRMFVASSFAPQPCRRQVMILKSIILAAIVFFDSLAVTRIAVAQNNTRLGTGALQNNTTGNNNTASGVNALFINSTGDVNTANGVNALFNNTTGDYNTASG